MRVRIISFTVSIIIVLFLSAAISVNAYSEDDIIAFGNYEGMDWRLTSDYELIFGAEGQTQYFNGTAKTITDDGWEMGLTAKPWHDYKDRIIAAKTEGTIICNNGMSRLFDECVSITTIDLSGFDTSNIVDMNGLFYECKSLRNINTEVLNTENVKYMDELFYGCESIESIDLSTVKTDNVKDMCCMFSQCKSLKSVNLNGINTQQVTDMSGLFAGCTHLSSLNLTSFNTGKLEMASYMFENCKSLKNLDLSSFNTRNLMMMDGTFSGCESMESINLSSFNTINVVNMEKCFENCSSLTELDLSNFNVEGVDSVISIFANCNSLLEIKTPLMLQSDAELPYTMFDDNGNEYTLLPKNKLSSIRLFKSSNESSESHGSFNIKDETIDEKYGYYYKDSYFDNAATEYNHSLATMSLCLAFSAYPRVEKDGSSPYSNYDMNVKDVMYKCGFTGYNYDKYSQYSFNERPTKTSIGCAIGSKKIADNTTLIAVAVRSSGYEQEWASNFDVGTSGDHMGFSQSATLVREDIGNYISSHGISGKIKIWITGFSRGAAVATQTAAKLNNGSFPNVTYSKDDVYAYGFATPAGAAMESDPNSNKYNNIFSLVHYHDIVPLVAPELWGFNRYGTTYVFPYSATELGSAKYEKEMKSYFEKMKKALGKSPSSYAIYSNWIIAKGQHVELGINGIISIGTLNRRIVDTIARNMGIRVTSIFTLNPRQNYRTVYQDIFTESAEKANADRKCNKDDASILIKSIGCLEPSNFKAFESANLIAKTIRFNPLLIAFTVENVSDLAMAHAEPEYYLSWMQVMDKNYGSSLTPTFKKGFGRYIKVNCPVDVHVYDSNGQLVASIVNEEVQEIDTSVLEAFIDENGQKTVMLPIDEQYRVEVTARENCDVGYTVEEVAGISDEPVRIVNYDAGNVNKGDTLLATADTISENEETLQNGSSVDYEAFNGEEKLNPVNDFCGDEEIRNHQYTIQVEYDENCGTAYGTGVYTEGSYVQLRAENREGFDFEGFYIDGNKVDDTDEDNDPKTVRLKVTGDLSIKAEFVKHVHQFSSWKVIKKATEVSAGQKTRTCSKCGFTEKTTIAMLKPTLPAVTIKAPKAAKKAATVKWKKLSKAKRKKIGYIQIQYSTDKKFKNGVKTVTAKKTSSSKKIKSLKSKKTYYVRIRSYKKSGSVIHISKWSKVKSVKAK